MTDQTTSTEPTESADQAQGEAQEEAQPKRKVGKPFSAETARAAAAKSWENRRGKAEGAHSREAHVLVPLDLEDVITGLRDKAKQGNAQAATSLLAYLNRFPVQTSAAEDWQDVALEDMTPDQLAFAEAWANRQVNRAMRKAEGLKASRARAEEDGVGKPDADASPPSDGTPAQ